MKQVHAKIGKVKLKNGCELVVLPKQENSDIVRLVYEGAERAREIKATAVAIAMCGPDGWISHAFNTGDRLDFALVGAIEDLKQRILAGNE